MKKKEREREMQIINKIREENKRLKENEELRRKTIEEEKVRITDTQLCLANYLSVAWLLRPKILSTVKT